MNQPIWSTTNFEIVKKEVKEKIKWLAWDLEKEYPFTYSTRKKAEKDIKIFNKERLDYEEKYFLFKLILK